MTGRDTGWDKWLFWVAYPIVALGMIHIGNDNPLADLLRNPTYYSDLVIAFLLTYGVGFYYRWYYCNQLPVAPGERWTRRLLGSYLLSTLIVPVLILAGLEAIYVILILGIDASEVSILNLELPLIFLFTSLVNASYLVTDLWRRVDRVEQPVPLYREQFVVHAGSTSRGVPVEDIAYFQVEDKITFLVETDGRRSILNRPLREIEGLVDPEQFFLLNRQVLTGRRAVSGYERTATRKLLVHLEPDANTEQYVSKPKATTFVKWLEGEMVSPSE